MADFFRQSELVKIHALSGMAENIRISDEKLMLDNTDINAYFASVIADFFRQKLLQQKISFTFETVMSSRDKVDLLKKAQSLGYRTYLYYIATEDPEINVSRVHTRVKSGGHPVPDDKIVSRYKRSLDLLMEAIQCTNRAYVFDNSIEGHEKTWIAEITDGKTLELKTERTPAWFRRAVWEKIH